MTLWEQHYGQPDGVVYIVVSVGIFLREQLSVWVFFM
jgi:hypothetical protein